METRFDWQEARQHEESLKKAGSFREILQANYDIWQQHGSGHNYKNRLPKILYYLGRLKAHEELKVFIERNAPFIELFIDARWIAFSNYLFELGNQYPDLSEEELVRLESYYLNPKFVDTLNDVLFDQQILRRPLKKYDVSVRKIRNTEFSNELKLRIFDAVDKNECRFDSYPVYTYFYDKEKNEITRREESRDFRDDGVQFFIDFNNIKIEKFAYYVKMIFGDTFFNYYSNDPIGRGENLEEVGSYLFAYGVFEELLKRLRDFSKPDKVDEEKVEYLKAQISEDWLQHINGLPTR